MAKKHDWFIDRWNGEIWSCCFVVGADRLSVDNYFRHMDDQLRETGGVFRVRDHMNEDHEEYWLVEEGEADEIHKDLALELIEEDKPKAKANPNEHGVFKLEDCEVALQHEIGSSKIQIEVIETHEGWQVGYDISFASRGSSSPVSVNHLPAKSKSEAICDALLHGKTVGEEVANSTSSVVSQKGKREAKKLLVWIDEQLTEFGGSGMANLDVEKWNKEEGDWVFVAGIEHSEEGTNAFWQRAENGVYRLTKEGGEVLEVAQLTKDGSRPLSPTEFGVVIEYGSFLIPPFDLEVQTPDGWETEEEVEEMDTIETSIQAARDLLRSDGRTYRIVDDIGTVIELWRDGQLYKSEEDLNETRGVTQLNVARQALAEARTIDDVVDVLDKAAIIMTIAKRRNLGLEVQNDAAEIRVRAERELGLRLADMEKNPGGRPEKETPVPGEGVSEEEEIEVPTLEDMGISYKQSSRFQKLSKIEEHKLDGYFAHAREKGQEITTSGALAIDKPDPVKKDTPPQKQKPIQLWPYNDAPELYKDAVKNMVTDNGDFYVLVWPKGSNQELELHTAVDRVGREIHRMGDVYFRPRPFNLDNGDRVNVGVDLHSIVAEGVDLDVLFDQEMHTCQTADGGRQVLRDIGDAIATIQLSVGIVPITGELFPFETHGLSVIKPNEWKAVVAQVRNISKEKAELLEGIIAAGKLALKDFKGRLVVHEQEQVGEVDNTVDMSDLSGVGKDEEMVQV